jgi:hypothetical protein
MRIRRPRIRLRRRTRILSIQCGICGQWRKPRHIRVPAVICRDCEPITEPRTRTAPVDTGTTPARSEPAAVR